MNLSRVILVILIAIFAICVGGFGQSISRDPLGRITKVLYPDSSYVSYTYDNGGKRMAEERYIPCSLMSSSTITASSDTAFCEGDSVLLTASNSKNYLWLNGDTTQSIRVTASGNYSVAVNYNGCIRHSNNIHVVVHPLPTCTITTNGDSSLCQGDSLVLDAGKVFSKIRWNTDDSTQTITVANTGDYYVSVTDSNGCSNISTVKNVIFNSPPPVPDITSSGPTTFCDNDSVVLSCDTSGSYLWSNRDTSQAVTVFTTDSFYVTITDKNGCSAVSNEVMVKVNSLPQQPTVTALGATEFCQGDSVTLSSSLSNTYSWSEGSTSQDISVFSAGNYIVSVTDSNGCSVVSLPVQITINPLPEVAITANGTTTFCSGNNVVLTANTANMYQWSNGASTQSITTNTSGNYTVTITDNKGCKAGSDATPVFVNPLPEIPVITPTGNTTICQGDSVTLSASNANAYLWSNGSTSQSISVTTAGDYAVTITDTNGCTSVSSSQHVSVNNSPNITISATGVTSFCEGGSVQFVASGNFANYTWNTGDTSKNIVITAQGVYEVTVIDNNGCTGISNHQPVTVYPLPQTPNIASSGNSTAFCQGDSIVLTTGNYSGYLWNTGATTQSITVSQADTFTVTVTNSDGCSATSAQITSTINPLPQTEIVSAGPPACCQGDSVILISYSGVNWTWSTGDTTQFATIKSSGSYLLTVTDSNGCSGISSPFQVTVHPLPVVTVTTNGSPYICQGDSIELTTANAISYHWNTGKNLQSIWVSESGNYDVTVTGLNGCPGVSDSVSVTVYDLPESPIILQNGPASFCYGDSVALTTSATGYLTWSNGENAQSTTIYTSDTIILTTTDTNNCSSSSSPVIANAYPLPVATITTYGATGITYCQGDDIILAANSSTSYLWSNGQTTQFVITLTANTYTLTVTDNHGCKNSTSLNIQVNPTPQLSWASEEAICGSANGSAMIFVSGGTSPYSYQWDSITGSQTDSIATGLYAGLYHVTVTDMNRCVGTKAVSVSTPGGISLSDSMNVDECHTCNGSVSVSVSGGIAPYTYQWSGPTGNQSSQTITGLCAGTYNLTVTDTTGCNTVSTFNVMATSLVNATLSVFDDYCSNSSGSVSAIVTSGTPPYSFQWSNGQADQTATGLGAGYIIVTVTDVNGCQTSHATLVNSMVPLSVISNTDSVSCYDLADGNASITPMGGNPPCSYLWSDGQSSQVVTGLSSGEYYVTVTDSKGCIALDSVTVQQPQKLIIDNSIENATCYSNADGQIVLSVSGGNPSYSYFWSNGDSTQILAELNAGNYIVSVSDQNGCSVHDTIVVAEPSVLDISTIFSNPICYGDLTSAAASVTGGTIGYAYLWSDGQTTATATGLTGGGYTLTVTDANGCITQDTLIIAEPDPLNTIIWKEDGKCGEIDGQAGVYSITSMSPFSYIWNTGQTTDSISGLVVGNYSVTVTDTHGCSEVQQVHVDDGIPLLFSLSFTPSIMQPCNGTVSVDIMNGTPPYITQWDFGPSTQTVTGMCAGTFGIIVSDSAECTATGLVTVNDCSTLLPAPTISTAQVSDTCTFVVLSKSGVSYQWYLNNSPITNAHDSVYVSTTISGSYTVVVTDTFGCMAISEPVTCLPSFTSEENNTSLLEVFPNPNRGTFVITFMSNNGDKDSVEILNSTGQKVKIYDPIPVKGKYIQEVNMTSIASGVYYVRVYSNGMQYTKRVVVE